MSGSSIFKELRFVFYTTGLMLVWLAVYVYADSHAGHNKRAFNDVYKEKSMLGPKLKTGHAKTTAYYAEMCQFLCALCHSKGFYCGEQCICQYADDNSKANCIGDIQDSARQTQMPFEILVQGKIDGRFVQDALRFEQKKDMKKYANRRRSTVTVYEPNTESSNASSERPETHSKRQKREANELLWFGEAPGDVPVIRPVPAPVLDLKKTQNKEQARATPLRKRQVRIDNLWLLEPLPNNRDLLRPAPLNAHRQAVNLMSKGFQKQLKQLKLKKNTQALVNEDPQDTEVETKFLKESDSKFENERSKQEEESEEQLDDEINDLFMEELLQNTNDGQMEEIASNEYDELELNDYLDSEEMTSHKSDQPPTEMPRKADNKSLKADRSHKSALYSSEKPQINQKSQKTERPTFLSKTKQQLLERAENSQQLEKSPTAGELLSEKSFETESLSLEGAKRPKSEFGLLRVVEHLPSLIGDTVNRIARVGDVYYNPAVMEQLREQIRDGGQNSGDRRRFAHEKSETQQPFLIPFQRLKNRRFINRVNDAIAGRDD